MVVDYFMNGIEFSSTYFIGTLFILLGFITICLYEIPYTKQYLTNEALKEILFKNEEGYDLTI
jgi:hypothetical protein